MFCIPADMAVDNQNQINNDLIFEMAKAKGVKIRDIFDHVGILITTKLMIDDLLSINGLKNEDVHFFKSELQPYKLKKKDNLLSMGQRCRHIALIEEGFLRTYHLDKDGKEVTTAFNQPDTFCSSYYSFYAQQASFEFIEAITDCDLHLLSYDSLQKLYAASWVINVFGRRVLEKACVERDFLLKKMMHLSAKAKYEWFLEKYPEVYKVAKLAHIASFLGINPETLSRIRRSSIS